MHATTILRRALAPALERIHGGRRKVLMHAIESLIDGRRLTLTDLSRSWPDAMFAHAPLKALDRLLSNHHLHGELDALHRAMAAWLMPEARPVIVVEWSDLKGDGRWCVLRAAVPVGGRTLTVCERIYPNAELNSPRTQRAFLEVLAQIVPVGKRPVIVSDAGFRSDWFRAVAARCWDYVGRIRNNTKVRQRDRAWRPCSTLFAGATGRAEVLGEWEMVQSRPWSCFFVRTHRNRHKRHRCADAPPRGRTIEKIRKRQREPWLLATSLSPERASAAQVVAIYSKRMQIELAFRDLKSHRFGMGFEDSLSRVSKRLAVLLLIHAMAAFAAWLLAMAIKTASVKIDSMTAQQNHRHRYSDQRRGLEWLRRRWWPPQLVKIARMVGTWDRQRCQEKVGRP
jgi:Transposase DDE domain